MADTRSLSQIQPGKGLGWMTLGASLQGILSRLKAQPQLFPRIGLSYSATEPIVEPVVVNLTDNGIRLRFDGPDQRLRLIEIIDFSKTTFLYKNTELVRQPTSSEQADPAFLGPSFRHIYNRLFGPAYAGEYVAPPTGEPSGTYILSYPGLAVRFAIKDRSWSNTADFVSLLTAVASPAVSMAIFTGSSWPEARSDLYTRQPPLPRSIALVSKNSENIADEVENVIIHSGGKLTFLRRTTPPWTVRIPETTPQDLIAELGPPDAIFRKPHSRLSIHATSEPSRNGSISPALDPSSVGTDRSSSGRSLTGYDDESDQDYTPLPEDNEAGSEIFYNYFHHGFDILVSEPTTKSPQFPSLPDATAVSNVTTEHKLVVTKIFLHGNIPGSYSFNRHRRSRWTIMIPISEDEEDVILTSEMRFSKISGILKDVWKDHYKSASEQESFQRGMVLNRGWGESPESSIELLGEMEDSTTDDIPINTRHGNGATSIGGGVRAEVSSNTQLFGFPGMLFEVVNGDLVSCVTVY